MLTKKKKFTSINLINLIIGFIPLSLIIGNTILNINIILVCLLGIVIYKFDIFKVNKQKYLNLLYAFFLYIIFITLFNNLPKLNDNPLYAEHIIKSFFFLRFLILFLVVNKLIEKKEFSINYIFISAAFFSLILSLDIMFQSIFGKNIIGLAMGDRPSSFFGTEHVAGGYIQKFSLFFIFLSAFYSKLKNQKYKNIFITFIISFVAIVLAGNRMPLIIFLSSFLVFFILQRNFKSVLVMVLVSVLIFFTIISFNKNLKSNASSFYSSVSRMVILAPKLFYHGKVEKDFSWGSGHLMVFNSGIQLWKKNKIFGSGLKSFRLNCSYVRFSTCESHPHNYSIEIMLETGLIGLILIYSFFLTNFFTFLKFYWKNSNLDLKFTIMPFFLIVLFEFFPLRSTGSFFTTSNSSVIFLTLAIFINFSKLNSFNKKFS